MNKGSPKNPARASVSFPGFRLKRNALKALALFWALLACSCAIESGESADIGEPLPSLVGTRWVFAAWGDQSLYFKTEDTVEYTLVYPADPALNETTDYHYEYDGSKKTGEIAERGVFLISRDNKTLHIPDYYIYGHAVDFVRLFAGLTNAGRVLHFFE
ncbi:MAG: hypothetical protein LBS57_00815 [Treponema sp.]|nr:hypothetical protein [Treponema sp.]